MKCWLILFGPQSGRPAPPWGEKGGDVGYARLERICLKIALVDIDDHICFKFEIIIIAFLMVASGSVGSVS